MQSNKKKIKRIQPDRLRELRESIPLDGKTSIRHLAKVIHEKYGFGSEQSIIGWESGKNEPTQRVIDAYISIYSTSYAFLVGDPVPAKASEWFDQFENSRRTLEAFLLQLFELIGVEKKGTFWKLDYNLICAEGSTPAYEITEIDMEPPEGAEKLYDIFTSDANDYSRALKEKATSLPEQYLSNLNKNYYLSEKDLEFLSIELKEYLKMRLKIITAHNMNKRIIVDSELLEALKSSDKEFID